MSSILCGNCKERHSTVVAVKACHTGDLFLCDWLVEHYTEDGLSVRDCGAEAVQTERGWTCAAGHAHVTIEARVAEGWDYAEDWGEAMNLAFAGVEPLTMSGHLVLNPASFH